MVKAQPERETGVSSGVNHGVEILSLVCQVFSAGCDRVRLADLCSWVLHEVSVGYVIVVPRTLAKGVRA